MATPEWINDFLRGGASAVLDGMAPEPTATATPERVPPSDVTDRERANPAATVLGLAPQHVTLLAVGLGVAGLIWLARQ